MTSPPTNKRKYPRVHVGVSGLVYLEKRKHEPVPCHIVDISLGGAFIHCTAPIQIGEELEVEIHFAAKTLLAAKVVRDPVEAKKVGSPEKSVVRWVRGSSISGFGVEFVEMSEEKKSFLIKLVEHVKRTESD